MKQVYSDYSKSQEDNGKINFPRDWKPGAIHVKLGKTMEMPVYLHLH